MKRSGTIWQLAVSLAMLSTAGILVAELSGLFPDTRALVTRQRLALCESLAVQCSDYASRRQVRSLQAFIDAIADRNREIVSLGMRSSDGRLLAGTANHEHLWRNQEIANSPDSMIRVPIRQRQRTWGNLEVQFQKAGVSWLPSWFQDSFVFAVLLTTCINLPVFLWFLARVLRRLDPSKVVPDRVRSALDSLAEGLLVLDNDERIVHANDSFAKMVGVSAEDLMGRHVNELPWQADSHGDECQRMPWQAMADDTTRAAGCTVRLQLDNHRERVLMVNSSAIFDDRGVRREALASFDDVTVLENKKAELANMLHELRRSRDDIQRQNEELHRLATRDVLTGCFNRRALFELAHAAWSFAVERDTPISCLMVDVDHFKSVNDQHGHSAGDAVLRAVGNTINTTARACDVPGRFGGEEFCLLMPNTTIDEAVAIGERLRLAIATQEINGLRVTASVGVAERTPTVDGFQGMLDQADKCLYVAKRKGRNRVIAWNRVTSADLKESPADKSTSRGGHSEPASVVPFHAVSALLSALAYRDPSTAQHSMRVADLCAAVGRELFDVVESYILEVAALLHDIGKIGVPDAILLKPGPLVREEWEVMRLHDRIGVEIIRSSFACPALTELVGMHHAKYGATCAHDDDGEVLPHGDAIPKGARLLSIADAYDAMVSDRVYRKGRSQAEAFAELRRCAGMQFDPDLVERFIHVLSERQTPNSAVSDPMSRQSALQLGLQVERIAAAFGKNDLHLVKSLSSHLTATSRKDGHARLTEISAELESLLTDEPDLDQIMHVVRDLMDVCRSNQRAVLPELSRAV